MCIRKVLFCVFVLHFVQCQEQEDCDTPFDLALEDNDEKYLAFMEELEKLTFNVADNCDDPKLIDELIWNYRLVLYEKYAKDFQNCQCAKIEVEFLNCTDVVWEMIKVEMQIKRAEFYGYCGKNYESLDKEKFELYEEYKDKIRECQCQDEESMVLECLRPVRDLMKADVTAKIEDLEENYCNLQKTPLVV